MNIVFRVDSSVAIGLGHVMRCLTIAEQLDDKNANIIFISREHEGSLNKNITKKGYKLYKLPPSILGDEQPHENIYSSWLGSTWEQDAQQVNSILKKIKPDLLVVDHYALDHRWEGEVRQVCNRIMVIDDLANRKHDCDLLLDQTTGRKAEDYKSLVSSNTTLLLGTQYALLRPDFSFWRSYSLQRRASSRMEKILVTLGGVDADNLTETVLNVLNQCAFTNKIEITVVMGESAPHIDKVKNASGLIKHETRVLINVTNMAEIMANSDLCIGAAGATSWERCCLGLPSLMIVIAENQENIAMSLQDKGAAIVIKSPLKENLRNEIEEIDSSKMKELSYNSSRLVDGLGVKRASDYIRTL